MIAPSASFADCQLPTTLYHSVAAILDARTLRLDDGSALHLADVLAPTAYDSPAAPKHWPSEALAVEALTKLTLNRNVAVSLERSARDRYGRRVGHALLTDTQADTRLTNSTKGNNWLQARLVAAGHARVALTPEIDLPCARQLLTLEAEAESANLGLWGQALYQPKRAEDTNELLRYRSTFNIVEGVVAQVSALKSVVYLNFGRDIRRDFTVKISRSILKRAKLDITQIRSLGRRPLRVRGWIERRGGPMITVWRPEQIELLTVGSNGALVRQHPPTLLSDTVASNVSDSAQTKTAPLR